MPDLMTIGYEGLTLADFLAILRRVNVETLVDVRELPLSRKPGFSKSALSAAVTAREIQYVHVPALGCPPDIRHDYRNDGDWQRYTQRFCAYLDTQQDVIQSLALRTRNERCCLLCFEADPAFCHRSYVAERVRGVVGDSRAVVHLQATAQESWNADSRAGLGGKTRFTLRGRGSEMASTVRNFDIYDSAQMVKSYSASSET